VRPGQIFSIGLNYRCHALQAGLELPREPIVASKSPWALAGPYDDLVIPPRAVKTDWEVELAVVIGRRAQYIATPAGALEHIAGYCTANDLSERSWLLERGGQWVKGKSFASFAPLGPFLVTTDEASRPNELVVSCRVNGEVMQRASTSNMVFDVQHLVHYVSQFTILEPGDVICTGSPAGMALGRPDQPFLKPGDLVEAEVHGLGAQRQRCRSHDHTDANTRRDSARS
jgi:2-keto-4-pentenoate hydratase/2-oxohepta-3-ene-1,7-dioic acid hydratase in catechol pathway